MKRAFTLVELLVVVAIIAIVAAIAIPNMLEAQTRSKVARAKADMRSTATALEAYGVDNTGYPNLGIHYGPGEPNSRLRYRLKPLTTPVGYITSLPIDPFNPGRDDFSRDDNNIFAYCELTSAGAAHMSMYAANTPNPSAVRWALVSYGPARNASDYPSYDGRMYWSVVYDPTNGTNSEGVVKRVGP